MGPLRRNQRVRVTARALLLTLSVTTLGPMLHGAHDAELAPVFVLHDESSHEFRAADRPENPTGDHCVACHFVRSSRGPVSWEPTGFHGLTAGNLLWHVHGQLPAVASAVPLPARAPPLA